MTDAAALPTGNIQVFIVEDELLPLRELEYDIRSAARLVLLGAWLGAHADDRDDDQLLDREVVDFLPVRRVGYGSPLTVDVQTYTAVIGYAVTATPVILAWMKSVGRFRLEFAQASESNARRDSIREETETMRSDRRFRQYRRRLQLMSQAADSLRTGLNDDDTRLLDHLVRQAKLKPELLEDSMDAIWQLSQKTVRVQEVTVGAGGDDGPAEEDLSR